MSVDPFDPFGFAKAMTEQMVRAQTRAKEAARQARLSTAKADVATSYAAWVNQPDGPATKNLQEAATAYLNALEM